jgi:F0F1-type ATP synthase assembly protein I
MANERQPSAGRGDMAFVFAIIIGLTIGILIKKVRLGIILGLIIGVAIVLLGWMRSTRK